MKKNSPKVVKEEEDADPSTKKNYLGIFPAKKSKNRKKIREKKLISFMRIIFTPRFSSSFSSLNPTSIPYCPSTSSSSSSFLHHFKVRDMYKWEKNTKKNNLFLKVLLLLLPQKKEG